MMLAQPAPEANLNAGEQCKVMQLVQHESPAVLYKAMQLLQLLLCFTEQLLCSDSMQLL